MRCDLGKDIFLDIPSPLLNYSQISVLDLLPKATNFQKRQNFLIQSTMHVHTWISQKKHPSLNDIGIIN